jgi:hypothetical protein
MVNVWLGPEEAGAPSAFDILDKSTLSDAWGLEGPDGGPVARDTWQPTRDDSSRLDAMHALCHRPYWSRIWIIQEVTLAKEIYIYSGCRKVRWDILKKHLLALNHEARLRKRGTDEYSSDEDSGDESSVAKTVKDICTSHCYKILENGMAGDEKKRPLAILIQDYGQNSCREPMDKVYGVLSLASDILDKEIPVRYSDGLDFLYLNVLDFCLKGRFRGNWTKMAFLSQTLQRAFGPDFHKMPKRFGGREITAAHESAKALDSGRAHERPKAHEWATEPDFVSNQRPSALAFALDLIEGFGPSLADYCAYEDRSAHPTGHPLNIPGLKISPRLKSLYRRRVQEFFENRIWETIYTLDCVRDEDMEHEGGVFFDPYPAQPYVDSEKMNLDEEDGIFPQPEPDYKKLQGSHAGPLPATLHPPSWNKYRFFYTQDTLGVITDKASDGDCICLLRGCYSAIVLRPQGNRFLLIGRAVFLRPEKYDDLREHVICELRLPEVRKRYKSELCLECLGMPLSVFQLITM